MKLLTCGTIVFMLKILHSFFLSFFLISSLFGSETPHILVTIAPFKFLVEEIAKGTVEVQWMVPPGASAHTFEPSQREMVEASKASIWFFLGEPFERKAINALQTKNQNLQLVDLRKGLTLLKDSCGHHHEDGEHHSCQDPHIWLSPLMVKIEARTIYDTLSKNFPENQKFYEENLHLLEKKLDDLDSFIKGKLSPFQGSTLMVSHPAYAYYAKEYGLLQLPIEMEGKEPTAKQLNSIIAKAKAGKVKTIFTQPQYSDKAALIIGKTIGANVVSVNPYAENIIENLYSMTEKIARGL